MPQSLALLIENDPQPRLHLQSLMEEAGVRCLCAAPDSVARGLAVDQLPDLIMVQACKDAPEWIRHLRSLPPMALVPILVLFAAAEADHRQPCLAAGADDLLAWPCDGLELQARVSTLMNLGAYRRREPGGQDDQQLSCLESAGAALTSGKDLTGVLQAVAADMVRLVDMKAGVICQWDSAATATRVLACHDPADWLGGRQAAGRSQVTADSPAARVLDAQQAYVLQEDPDGHLVLMVPMVYGEQTLGLVELVGDGSREAPSEQEVALLQLIANLAASAIRGAQLNEVTNRHIAEVTTLNTITQTITSSLDLHETLAIIADHALWLLNVEAASVILYDEDSGELWFGASSGQGAGFIRGRRLSQGKGIVNWVVEHGEPVLVSDATQDPRFFGEWDQETGTTTHSLLCVPLQAKGATIGAIEAINKTTGEFDRGDLTLLRSMAAAAAIAIENARLYRELRHHADSLEDTVTERTRELQAERDRTQAILEALGEAVIVTNLAGEIQYLNPAAEALTGYTSQEVVGRDVSIWQQDRPATAPQPPQPATMPAVLQTQSVEVVSRRKDGTLYDAMVTIAPLFDSHEPDQCIGHVFVQRDITPIKETERLKDQFVSNVSHELRTPLSVIALMTGNLDRLYDRIDDEKRRKMIRDVRQHAQILGNLINDVLEISRIDSGRISMGREDVDLLQLARQEAEKQMPLARRKRQSIHIEGDEPVPVWVQADQIRQVIRNLLNNAIKYTPQSGDIVCHCTTLLPPDGDDRWPGMEELGAGPWAALRVVDTGIGIAPEDMPRIFDRFFRVKTETNVPGTGLGLAIARELVEAHGGQIAAASTLEQGSTFAVYLPLSEE